MNPGTFDAVAERFRVLGVPLRLQILNELAHGERSVGDLVEATGSSQPNISKHLGVLRAHGFVTRQQRGNTVFYGVTDKVIFKLCELVCGSIETNLERQRRLIET